MVKRSPATERFQRRAALLLAAAAVVLLFRPARTLANGTLIPPWSDYTQEDGLASNNVLAVTVGEGEVWFGTDHGISRYNGAWHSWTEGADLQGGVYSLTLGETSSELWAGTATGAVLTWNANAWDLLDRLDSPVRALHYAAGQLWIGTAAGLYIWNGDAPSRVTGLDEAYINVIGSSNGGDSIWVGTSDGLWLRHDGRWSAIGEAEGLPAREVTALWADAAGPVWVAAGGNIAWRNPATGAWEQVETNPLHARERVRITSLAGDGTGTVWVGTEGGGFFRLVEREVEPPASVQYQLIPQSINSGETSFIHAVAVDRAGSLWLGTVSGVFRSDREIWGREIHPPAASPANEIQTMLADEKGRLWIGTRGEGIRRKAAGNGLADEAFFDVESGLPSLFVTDLALDASGRIWAGTWWGLASLEPGAELWVQPVPPETLPSALVTAVLAQDRQLWIGTDTGLARYDLDTRVLSIEEALTQQVVQDLALDASGRLWAATESGGIFVGEPDGRWTRYQAGSDAGQSTFGDNVAALVSDPKVPGAMWAAVNQHGLIYFDGQVWHDRTATARLPSKLFYDLYVDPVDASLWIGSEGGVTRYDGRTWETLIVESVLPAASISSIVRSPGGLYWFGSREGLTFHRPDSIPPWIRIEEISGQAELISANAWKVESDGNIIVGYEAGDLYTPQSELVVLYRLSPPGELGQWRLLDRPFLELSDFSEKGRYTLEFQVRDFAFTYSEISSVSFEAEPLPAQVRLPLLGSIRTDYLITLIVTGLLALIGFGYMGIEVIQTRRRALDAVVRSFNPFISGEPVRREDMFFGRREMLQKIVDTLHNNSIMIHGERRIGKTTLLYQLNNHLWGLEDEEYWFVPLYVDLEGTEEDTFFHFLMEEILHTASTLSGLTAETKDALQDLLYYRPGHEQYTDREFIRDLRDVIKALQHFGEASHPGKRLRLILLMDEMDVFNAYDHLMQQRLRRIFMRDFAATLGAVIAGIRISKEWGRIESPWYNLFNEIEVEPFTREQAMELLTEPVRGFYRYEPGVVDFIIENCAGRPFRIQQYGLEAVGRMLADGRRTITMADAVFAHGHIQQMGDTINIGLSENVDT
jgi:ligand-binding sensor domain-containing protein